MPKFTPGPWKLYSHSLAPWEQHRIENDHGNHVCELMEADQPDARLIAAAPELYEALRNLADDCLIVAESLNDYPPCTQPSLNRNDASRKLKQYASDALGIIAKVDGEA